MTAGNRHERRFLSKARSGIWNRAQTTAEYAILIGVVVAAIVGMQVYVKRGMNAKLKDASDSAIEAVWSKLKGSPPTPTDRQYEPYYASSTYNVTQKADRQEKVETGGVVKKENVFEETTRTGSQTTGVAQ